MKKYFYKVSLPLAIDQTFIYQHDSQISNGSRVLINFKNKDRIGIALDLCKKPSFKTLNVKEVLDESVIFNKVDLELLFWTSKYYFHPIGQVIDTFTPAYLKKLNPKVEVKAIPKIDNKKYDFKFKKSLTSKQKDAFKAIIKTKSSKPILLNGITGSGKTEVYARVIAESLQNNQGVLILTPEIALTPQLSAYLKDIFNDQVETYHSGVTPKRRYEIWEKARSGETKIYVGTRSAVLLPIKNLGLIIVDEEHDQSYKQNEGLLFSARDLAIKRADLLKIPIILGSGTPSLRSLHQCEVGKYIQVLIDERVHSQTPPEISIHDTNGMMLNCGLSDLSIQTIKKTVADGKLAMIFINRRGYAPEFSCGQCDWIATCHHCETNMVMHIDRERLVCHRCESVFAIPPTCPNCMSDRLDSVGQGTQRIEAFLKKELSIKNVFRFDSDATKNTGDLEALVDRIQQSTSGVIVGTQMLTKGHNFKDLELVVVLNIDHGLTSVSPFALEDMAHKLIQVSGRAGRESGRAKVILQTRYPSHPTLQRLEKGDYNSFAESVLSDRALQNIHPFYFYISIKSSSTRLERNINFLSKIISYENLNEEEFAGPMPLSIYKQRGKYNHQLVIMSASRTKLHQKIESILKAISRIPESRQLSWKIDVDPLQF